MELERKTRRVVQAQHLPVPNEVVRQVDRQEGRLVSGGIAPVFVQDAIERTLVRVFAHERCALQEQEHAGREEVLVVVLRTAELFDQVRQEVRAKKSASVGEWRQVLQLDRLDERGLQLDRLQSAETRLVNAVVALRVGDDEDIEVAVGRRFPAREGAGGVHRRKVACQSLRRLQPLPDPLQTFLAASPSLVEKGADVTGHAGSTRRGSRRAPPVRLRRPTRDAYAVAGAARPAGRAPVRIARRGGRP